MRSVKCTLASLAILAMLGSNFAHADLNICNKTIYKLSAAISFNDNSDSISRGWYHIEPGTCVTPIDGPLIPNGGYRYYAKVSNGKKVSGDSFGCLTETRMDDLKTSDCQRDLKRVFRPIDTEGQENWTQSVRGSKDSYMDILPSEIARLNAQMRPQQSSPDSNNSGAGLAAAAALLGLFVLSQDARRKNEEEACMRRCTRSKGRCVELCTQ